MAAAFVAVRGVLKACEAYNVIKGTIPFSNRRCCFFDVSARLIKSSSLKIRMGGVLDASLVFPGSSLGDIRQFH
jgi:hypothetical protein